MAAEVHHIFLEYDVRGDLTLYHIASALEATSSQYRRLAKRNPVLAKQSVDLYVEEISMQSPLKAKLLVASAIATQLYMAGNIYNFSHDILYNMAYDLRLLAGEETDPEKKFSNSELDDYSRIIKPITLNQGSRYNFLGQDNSRTTIKIEIPWDKANVIENQIREKRKINALPDGENIETEVLLYIDTAVNKTEGESVGDKGTIENIYSEPLKLYFPEDRPEIKEKVLANPFKQAFIVTVDVLKVHNKPFAYKILEIHDTIPRDLRDVKG